MTHTQFTIQQLRMENSTKVQESIMVFIAALFVTAILPSLLIQFVYSQEDLFAQPQLVMYIPVASFLVAMAYFLYVVIGNWRRSQKARQLEGQLSASPAGQMDSDHLSDTEMKELEELVDQALKPKSARKPRAAVAKTSRKTTKKAVKKN
jgi:hypothetical protein